MFFRLVSTEISEHCASADNIEIKCLSVHCNIFCLTDEVAFL